MIELAKPEDREAVNHLAREVHAMHVAWRPDIYEMPTQLYPEERFHALLESESLYVVRLDGTVAGYAAIKIRDYDWPGVVRRKVLFIDEICVEKKLRGRGIGWQMMTDIRDLAKSLSCTDLQLGVYPQNEDAIAFYERCGFQTQSMSMHSKL